MLDFPEKRPAENHGLLFMYIQKFSCLINENTDLVLRCIIAESRAHDLLIDKVDHFLIIRNSHVGAQKFVADGCQCVYESEQLSVRDFIRQRKSVILEHACVVEYVM